MQIHVSKDGEQFGPYTVEQLREYVQQGDFLTGDYACFDEQTWVTIAEVPGFADGGDSVTQAEQSPVSQKRAVQKDARSKKQALPTKKKTRDLKAKTPSSKKESITAGKQQYLKQIRANTAYPTYRGTITVITILGYLLAALNGLSAVSSGLGVGVKNIFGKLWISWIAGLGIITGGLIISALIFVGARFWKEAALIVADIGDSTIETNSKSSTQ